MKRHIEIAYAAIEDDNGAGDACYDLVDTAGTPDQIGKLITEALHTADLATGRTESRIADGDELTLGLTIRIRRATKTVGEVFRALSGREIKRNVPELGSMLVNTPVGKDCVALMDRTHQMLSDLEACDSVGLFWNAVEDQMITWVYG